MERDALQDRRRRPKEDGATGGGRAAQDSPQQSRLSGLAAALNSARPVQRLAMMNAQPRPAPSRAQGAVIQVPVIQAKVFAGEEELSNWAAVRDYLVQKYEVKASKLDSQKIMPYLRSPDRHDVAEIAAALGLPLKDAASTLSTIPSAAPPSKEEPIKSSSVSSKPAGGMMASTVQKPGVPAPATLASSSAAGRGPSQWSAEQQGENAPAEARELMEKFAGGGLLISTLQSENLGGGPRKDLVHAVHNNLGSKPEGKQGVRDGIGGKVQDMKGLPPEQTRHPTLNWSVAHRRLVPSYYGMTSGSHGAVRSRDATDSTEAMRTVGMLADPLEIGDRFRSNNPAGLSFGKDNATSNTAGQGNPSIYTQAEAIRKYERLRDGEIAEQQKTPGVAMQTTEIKTLGFSPHAVLGFVATHIDADRSIIQEAVDAMPGGRQNFPIFTWEVIDGQTQLRFVEMITKRPPEAASEGKMSADA